MKRIILLATTSALCALHLSAAVPLSWTVETSRLSPAVWDVVRGETIALEATFNTAGKPFAMDGEACSIFWQTNGMGSAWWTAPAAAVSNRVSAVFTPAMDPGASSVIGFLGSSGSVYRAAFTLRFRHGPGSTPNVMPLPTPVIDFAKVQVLNPPWGGDGVNTNAVIDIIHKTVDGAARPLPKYLHELSFDDTYPEDADEYYRSRGNGQTDGGCSAVRSGGYLYRNFDFPFDDRAEFVVRMSAGPNRFASVGVAQVGTNLTEQIVTSGKPSRCYKWLPGATVDGINENGVACEINVVDGEPAWSGGASPALHPLAAVRWILDNATNAQHAAEYISAHIAFPPGWTQNFHYMIADERDVFIVENGQIEVSIPGERKVLTNFNIVRYPRAGMGLERFNLLASGANITNAWYTRAYRRETNPPWVSDLAEVLDYTNEIFTAWAAHPKEYFRGKTNGGEPWWQTVHTSIYDLTNRTLRIAVQEQSDWYVFALAKNGTDEAKVREIAEEVVAPVASSVTGLQSSVSGLQSSKRDMTNLTVSVGFGWLDLPATLSEVEIHYDAQGDPEGNHWHWQGRDSESGIRWGTKPGTYFFWPTAEAASNALEVVWDYYPDEVVTHRGPVKDRLALQSSITGLASSVSGLQSSKLDKSSVDPTLTTNGVPADAAAVGNLPYMQYEISESGMLKMSPAHCDETPNEIDFMDYQYCFFDFCDFRSFQTGAGTIYGILMFQESDYSATLDVYGLNLNNQTTYSLSSISCNGVGFDFPHRDGTFALDDWISLSAMLDVSTASDLASHQTFSNAVLAVGLNIDTNSVAVLNEIAATFGGFPIGGTATTVGGLLAALAAAVAWLRKRAAHLESDGTADDDFATDLLGKPVAKTALMIPLEAKTDSFAAEDGHAYAVTMTGTVTITMPTTTAGKAAIFQARFSAVAQQSVEFSTTDLVKFDGTDCGIVKAGKDALLSAMWNGEAWDLVWKNQA